MQPGTIIVLNGTTSSGKSTLLRELQTRLEPPYLESGIDKYLYMLPERYLSRPLWEQVLGNSGRSGELGHRLFTGMHHALAALSRCGNNVLADHVFIEASWAADCAAALHDLPAYLIGVHCPLDVLERREKSRGDRTLGHARAQFAVVHQSIIYDLEVNTSVFSPTEAAQRVIQRLHDGPPTAFADLYQRLQSEKPSL
jgi:chloramphenicol 3-O phosphotransferase